MNNSITFDDERFPLLTEAGRDILKFMLEHPNAPIYRNESGNRLTSSDLDIVKQFERSVNQQSVTWTCNTYPDWLNAFVERQYSDVPYFRKLGKPPAKFKDIPTVSRRDLAADIAQFVPDSVETKRLINFQTTGTTGNPLLIASHPVVAACYLPFHIKALRRFHVELRHGSNQVGVVLIGYQKKCFTYVSVTPLMDESGLAKINLHPDDWQDPEDRALYLDALKPEIYTGDPLSFHKLLELPIKHKPRALISVGMMLSDGLKQELMSRFYAPVLDIYSLNEAGPIAVYDEEIKAHVLLQPNLFVEILDNEGNAVSPGERGEITLTGGFNFCMPLLRYRTGDFASLIQTVSGPVLQGLSGRLPVRYFTGQGEWVNNIDITHALKPIPIPQFSFYQSQHGELTLSISKSVLQLADIARQALIPIFGSQEINVVALEEEDKVIQYRSDFEGSIL